MPDHDSNPTTTPWGEPHLKFRCRPPYFGLILAILLFGAMAFFMVGEAATNKRGLVINGIIHLGPAGATNFYWLLFLASGLFSATAVVTLLSCVIKGVPDVILERDTITFPAGFPVKRAFALRYSEITGLSLWSQNRQRCLMLQTRSKKHYIQLNWLAAKNAEAELSQALQWCMAASNARRGQTAA